MTVIRTAFSRDCWGRSVDEFCLPVKVSLCRSLFAASLNVATSQPGYGVFECLLMAPEGLGSESRWKWWARGSGFFCKNLSQFSANFIPFYPLQKSNFSSVWHDSPSRWLPFEHSGTQMGSLGIDPVYSTLCSSISSTRSTSKFHLNTFQNSVGGAVKLDAIAFFRPGLYMYQSHVHVYAVLSYTRVYIMHTLKSTEMQILFLLFVTL